MADLQEDEPGARSPAPGVLRTVQRFVNTNDREGGRDLFEGCESLAKWLRDHNFGDHTVSESDRRRLVAFREALRASLLNNNNMPADGDCFALLNAELTRSGTRLTLAPTGPRLVPVPDGIDGVVGSLFSIVFSAMLDGTWIRLKACRRHLCQWVFYDQSRNRSGAWCTMSICGNRAKTSAYWRRRHGSDN